ncbi:proline-rich protein 36-like [Anastrepha ludens]|uniref:proline-rich protein 36-like n=1 Tax=Anastrepha ludens TaxID=28586 RepID=UPI0023AFFD19|nr:proline-rich protein 36-like [Anastrepha ludens]
MSNPHDSYFENRRTNFNSMHHIDEERVSGYQPAQAGRGRQCLAESSTHFPPSPRQYEAREFGLCEDEEFRHPRMFENLAYETDASAFEAMRRQNARPPYQQQPRFNISDLPSEQIDDFSNPQFSEAYDEGECNVCPQQQQTPNISDISAPDFCDISDASPWPAQSPPMQQQQRRQSYTSECLDDMSAPMYDSPVGSPTPQPHYTPIGLMDTPDVCAPTPRTPTPTPPHYSPIRFQPSPVQYPSECLEDVSVPSFAQTPCDAPRTPSPRRVQTPQNLPSDMICDVSPLPFASPPTPSLSYPSEALDEMTMPSFENASCGSPLDRRFLLDPRLADESPPQFASSGASSSRRSYSRGDTPCLPAECQPQQSYEATSTRERSSPARRFNLSQIMSQRSSPSRSPSRSPSPVCPPTPPAPHFSLRSPTPVGGYSLADECLMDVSEPTLVGSSSMSPYARPFPDSLPSECLGDISEPSYQMTPPPRTPSMPHDLPFEQICDISQPMYESPRSERLSSMSMPSFDDTSCGSPLDRRFLLDPNIMDESPPDFASSRASSPCRSLAPSMQPRTPRRSPSSRGPSSRVASPQRSMSSRHFSPLPSQQRSRSLSPICSPTPPAPHFSLRSPTPIRTPPVNFSALRRASLARRQFPSNMTNECLADISAPSYANTTAPRTPSMPHDLPSDMLCDISQPMYQSPGSEHLSSETMPSFDDTSCSSPLDRRFLLDPRLADESPPQFASSYSSSPPASNAPCPSMASSRSRGVSPKRPSTPGAGDASSFDKTYCEILQRFQELKCKVDTPQRGAPGSASVGRRGMPPDECVRETVIERTENENGQLQNTAKYIAITVDPCGSVKTHTKEIKTQFPRSPGRLAPPSGDSGVHTQNTMPGSQIENLRNCVRRRLSFDLSDMPNENLVDMSPPCADDLPSMSTENILQHLSSIPEEQLSRVSAPSFRTPPTPSISYPSEMLEEMTIPSFENASCGSPLDRRFLLDPRLADESPPQFASSYSSSPSASNAAYQSGPCPSDPCMRSRTPTHSPARSPQRDPSSRRFSLRSSPPSEVCSPPPPLARISLRSPTPIGLPPGRPFPVNLPSEQLLNISEPAFFSGPPRASPQMRYLSSDYPCERLDDISQPSYQQTPPPRTPVFPTDLPSELLGNISTPSYRSPASEHISSISMPTLEDISYESPLDRRFLLDPRIADESMPTLPEMQSTQQSVGTPRPQTARRRLSYSQEDSGRGNAPRNGNIRSGSEGRGGPATVEKTHTTIKQSGSYQQEHSVTPGTREDKPFRSTRQRGQSPLIDAAQEQLKITTSVHSITQIYTNGAAEGPTGSQGQRRSMSLPSENLGDISMPPSPPSMRMSTTGRSQQGTSFPSGSRSARRPQQRKMSSAPSGSPSQRSRQRRPVQDINDISPISFASTIPSTDMSSSAPRRGGATGKYTSTSSRGLSGLANYAPFFEQIRSRNNSNACDPCSPCCPTVQDVDECDPCAGFTNARPNRNDPC